MISNNDSISARKDIFVMNIFIIIISTLLIVNYARSIYNGSFLTFEALLDTLSNCPSIDISSLPNLFINGDWGWFDFFRSTLNMFTSILQLAMFVSVNVANVIIFLFYIINSVLVPIF